MVQPQHPAGCAPDPQKASPNGDSNGVPNKCRTHEEFRDSRDSRDHDHGK